MCLCVSMTGPTQAKYNSHQEESKPPFPTNAHRGHRQVQGIEPRGPCRRETRRAGQLPRPSVVEASRRGVLRCIPGLGSPSLHPGSGI